MSTRILVSLAASVLITAGTLASLAAVGPTTRSAPATTDGLPVTNLPGITVTASVAPGPAQPAATPERSVAIVNASPAVHGLLEDATAQVAVSHLSMPYYSFGANAGQTRKD